MDCKHVGTLLRDHELNPKISGIMLFYYLLSVVEIDMPWDDSQVDTYGSSWTDDQVDIALTAIKDAMPLSKIAFVVFQFYF